MSASVETIVIADTSVVINLLHVERLSMMSQLSGIRLTLPDEVVAEVTNAEHRALLDTAISGKLVDQCSLDALGGSSVILDLAGKLGKGELACLALAEQHGWTLAADERGLFRREAIQRIGELRLITTADLYVRAIRQELITVTEADADKAILVTKRFTMKFGSFQELISQPGE